MEGLPNVDVRPLINGTPQDERRLVSELASRERIPTLEAGHSLLSIVHLLFPELGLNGALALAAFGNPRQLTSTTLRRTLLTQPQEPPPDFKYAFIDHHPNTQREIPPAQLRSIEERGLHLVENPRDKSLWRTLALLDQAAELHLVSSAPLCLALVADATAPVRIRYREPAAIGLMRDYNESWIERSTTAPGREFNRHAEWLAAHGSVRPYLTPLRRFLISASTSLSFGVAPNS